MAKRKTPKISRSAQRLIDKIATGQRDRIKFKKRPPSRVEPVEFQQECGHEK